MQRDLYQDIDYILIDQEKIHNRIQELAAQLEETYKDAQDLLFICVLKGGFVFMSDLSRACKFPHMVDFMAVSSYGHATTSSGQVQIIMDLKSSIANRDILIVEDIIDTGLTLHYLLDLLYARQPRSIRICTLLSKPSRHQIDIPIDFLGFEVPDEFVVGYGLDYGELYRNIPYIAVLKPETFS